MYEVVIFCALFLFFYLALFFLTSDTQTVQRDPEKPVRFSKQKIVVFVLKNGPAFQGLFEQPEHL